MSPIPGDEAVIYQLHPGDYFGEAMVLGRRKASTCIANSFCELYTLGREDLLEMFKRFPKEGGALYNTLQEEMERKDKHQDVRARTVIAFMKKGDKSRNALMLQRMWHRFYQYHAAMNNPFHKLVHGMPADRISRRKGKKASISAANINLSAPSSSSSPQPPPRRGDSIDAKLSRGEIGSAGLGLGLPRDLPPGANQFTDMDARLRRIETMLDEERQLRQRERLTSESTYGGLAA